LKSIKANIYFAERFLLNVGVLNKSDETAAHCISFAITHEWVMNSLHYFITMAQLFN